MANLFSNAIKERKLQHLEPVPGSEQVEVVAGVDDARVAAEGHRVAGHEAPERSKDWRAGSGAEALAMPEFGSCKQNFTNAICFINSAISRLF